MQGWNYNTTDISKTVEANVLAFFDWEFINRGALHNVQVNVSGAYNNDLSRLRLSSDPRYTTGRVWELPRSNLVWESGLAVIEPIRISGVYVNNTLRTDANIDYIHGRVIFPSAIALNSNVRMNYSYKEVQFGLANTHPWLRQVQNNSRRVDSNNYLLSSGGFFALPEGRVQLPYVGISVYNRSNRGYQLGGSHYVDHTIRFYILAEDEYSSSKIADTICNQEHHTIYMFNLDQMIPSGFPLNYNGTLNSWAKTYPDLVKHSGEGGYRYTNGIQHGKGFLYDTEMEHGQWIGDVYYNTVSLKVETIVTKI